MSVAFSSYDEALSYVNSRPYVKGCKGVTSERMILDELSKPQDSLKFIHIAGTNGKGSSAVMLSEILIKSGLKTGLYTSPFIYDFRERIQIDGEMISQEDFRRLSERVSNIVEENDIPAVTFDIVTAVAILYYKEQGCDVVVFETGLGGTYDATNVIDSALVQIITTISLDHVKILGDTIEEIAASKAGIIKPLSSVVFYGENDKAYDVIREKCEQTESSLVCPDFTCIETGEDTKRGQHFSYKGYKDVFLPLVGEYQRYNCAVVLEAVEVLRKKGIKISEQDVLAGLSTVKWPSRFECFESRNGYDVILDGSHNPEGVENAMGLLDEYYPDKKKILIYGVMKDKDVSSNLAFVSKTADVVISLHIADFPRAMAAEEITELLEQKNADGKITVLTSVSPADAVTLAKRYADKESVVFIGGSLFMAGYIRPYMDEIL